MKASETACVVLKHTTIRESLLDARYPNTFAHR